MPETISLAQLAAGVKPTFAPDITLAFKKASEMNPKLTLEKLDAEDKAVLSHWFNRYYGIHVTQVANLRETITNPSKHLALDLVALMKDDVKERAGLSSWFPAKSGA
jgi:hypothetical protein